jgi:fused signal recognition particle receptor
MFSKLKDKLKSALSVFSKKAESEAVEEEVVKKEAAEESIVKEVADVKEEVIEAVDEEVAEVATTRKSEKDIQKQEVAGVKKNSAETDSKEVVEDVDEGLVKEETSIKKEVVEEEVDEAVKEETTEIIEKGSVKEVVVEEAVLVEKDMVKEEVLEKVKENPTKEKSFFDRMKDTFSFSKVSDAEEVVDTKKDEMVKEVTEVSKDTKDKKEEVAKETKSIFGRVKQSLTTKTISADKFDELFWELELALLENNVSVQVIEKIKQDLRMELVDKPLPRDVFGKISETLQTTLDQILSYDKVDILSRMNQKKPYVIALFGINGAGKTTSIAKLTKYLQKHNKTVVLAACDTFRAAAIQQLEEHANKLGVKIIKHDYGADAAAVAYDAIKYAEKQKIDAVLIDTAGRLHSNTNLMAELDKIIRITKPDLKLFVGESITGNDCIEQAQKFNELVKMDGAILTKVDVDEKGGAPLSISYIIKKPILFLGVGQNYEDLEEFNKSKILERLGLK